MSTIDGHQQVLARLQALAADTSKKIFRAGLKAGAGVVLPVAQSMAPDKSGRMRENLKIRPGGSRKGTLRISVGANIKDFTGPAFYTGFVLWSHKVGSRKLGAGRKSTHANDFITRAYEQTKMQALDLMMTTILTKIDRIAGGSNG